jgi:dienelactone hydrolase
MQPLMLTVIALASTLSVFPRAPRPLTAGDWVGQIRVGDSSRFVRLRFESDTSGRADLPVEGRWGIGLTTFRRTADTLSFVVPVPDDTLRFATTVDDAFLTGRVQSRLGSGIFRSIHRMPYDSALIRPLAGTYRIARDREIAMGPLDEAGGWLSFFDTRTRRAGVLYALDDSTLFTGPSFGVDFPIAIRATIARASSGGVTGLRWQESGAGAVFARRARDIRQDDVVFHNGSVRLVGNVTAPTSPGRHPAVVLIHGCCGMLPTRDFGYWSSYLAHHGLVVLAYDRRGGGASSGDANSPFTEIADDVVVGVRLLQQRSDVDPKRVGVFGMSNGGYVAPLAVTRSGGRIAFVAVRSGSARRVGGNIDYEVEGDLRSAGFSDTDVARGVALRRRVTDFVVDHPKLTKPAWDSLQREVAAVQNERWYSLARVMWVPRISVADSGAMAYVDNLRTDWGYDPLPYWSHVRVPVYVMLGGLDRSVPTAESAQLLRDALARAGNTRAIVRVFPSGNHGLLEARTGFDAESRLLDRYVAGFQDGLVRWIRNVAGS